MEHYKNLSGKSGISAYEILPDSLIVQFPKYGKYSYSSSRIQNHYIEKMKTLAMSGKGLNTFINTNPDIKNYADKLN